MLAPSKKAFYNKAPLCYLASVGNAGYNIIVNNGEITDIEINAEPIFNHAHSETVVNLPIASFRAIKIG